MEKKDIGERYDAIRNRVRIQLENKPGINNGLKEIIAEIVVRRCEEFSLSAQELNRDLESLDAFLDTVKFRRMSKGYENAAGVFSIAEKRVSISQPYLDRLRNEILNGITEKSSNWNAYQTFTHEIYHAMSKFSNGRDRMTHFSAYTGEQMKNLLETITEVSAMRACSLNNEKDFLNGIRRCRGYSDVTFTVGVMAAAFGLTEKEFVKAGMEGYIPLEASIIKSAGTPNAMDQFVDLDIITEKMHSELYPWGDEQAPTKEQLAQNLYTDARSLITMAQTTMRDRLMYSDKPVEELAAEMMYNHNKLENNLTFAIQGFAYRIDRENVMELHDYNKSEGLETRKLVRGLYRIVERKDELSPEEYKQAIEDIRSGRILEDYDKYAEMYGLESVEELEKPPEHMPESYMKKVRKDDFDDGRVWDNSDILKKVRDSIINNKLIHKIEDSILHAEVKLRDSIERLMPRIKKILALPEANQNTLPISKINQEIEKESSDSMKEQATEPMEIMQDTEPMEIVQDTEPMEIMQDTEPMEIVQDTEPMNTVREENIKDGNEIEECKEIEQELAFGELPPEQKRIAQEGYLNALRAIQTKEGGIEDRKSGKEDREI